MMNIVEIYEKRILGLLDSSSDIEINSDEQTYVTIANYNIQGKYSETASCISELKLEKFPIKTKVAILLEDCRSKMNLTDIEASKVAFHQLKTLIQSSDELVHSVFSIDFYFLSSIFYTQLAEYEIAIDTINSSLEKTKIVKFSHYGKELEVHLLSQKGFILWISGHLDESEIVFEEALKLIDNLEYTDFLHEFYDRFAGLNYAKGNFDRAEGYMNESVKSAERTGNKEKIATAYTHLGIIYQQQTKFEKAIDKYITALNIRKEQGTEHYIANSYLNLASAYGAIGKLTEQVDHLNKALAIYQKMSMRREMIVIYDLLGQSAIWLGKFDRAKQYYESALKLAEDYGTLSDISQEEESLAAIHAQIGQIEEANSFLESAISKLGEINNPSISSSIYLSMVDLQVKRRNIDLAKELLKKLHELTSEDDPTPLINHRYLLAKVIILKSSERVSEKFSSYEDLETLIHLPETTFRIKFRAILIKIELLILEIKIANSEPINQEFEALLNLAQKLCLEEHRYASLLQLYLLVSKFYLLSNDIQTSIEYVEKAKELVTEKNLSHLRPDIETLENEININMQYWKNMVKSMQSVEEKMKKSKIEDYLELVLSRYSN